LKNLLPSNLSEFANQTLSSVLLLRLDETDASGDTEFIKPKFVFIFTYVGWLKCSFVVFMKRRFVYTLKQSCAVLPNLFNALKCHFVNCKTQDAQVLNKLSILAFKKI
jgi:hypothetical protein